MKTKSIFISLLFLISACTLAQDIIYKTDKTEIKAKIIEVLDNDIKYKKFEFLDGPTYSMSKSDIFMIIYKNGQKEMFDNDKSKNTPKQKETKSEVVISKIDAKKTSNSKQQLQSKKEEIEFTKTNSEYGINNTNYVGAFELGTTLNNWEIYTVPPIIINAEAFKTKNLGFGTHLAYSYISSSSSFGNTTISSSAFSSLIGLRGNFYLNEILKINPNKIHFYGGVTLSMNIVSTDISSNSSSFPSKSDTSYNFGYFAQVGGRNFFSERFGLISELQFASGGSNLMVGLTYRSGRK